MSRTITTTEMQDVLQVIEYIAEATDTYGHLPLSDLAVDISLTDSNGELVGTITCDSSLGFVFQVADEGVTND